MRGEIESPHSFVLRASVLEFKLVPLIRRRCALDFMFTGS